MQYVGAIHELPLHIAGIDFWNFLDSPVPLKGGCRDRFKTCLYLNQRRAAHMAYAIHKSPFVKGDLKRIP